MVIIGNILSILIFLHLIQVINNSIFSELIRINTINQRINYSAFANNVRFEGYLRLLSNADIKNFKSEEEKLAFYLNTFNAFTIKALSKYSSETPISFNLIKDFKLKLVGREITIGQLHKFIREEFQEPLVHFGMLIPEEGWPLITKAFNSLTVMNDLKMNAKNFIRESGFIFLDRKNKKLHLAKLFELYKSDFGENTPSLIAFLLPYMTQSDKGFLKLNKVELIFE